ncbi:MAG: DUF167 domain-containing protein [Parvularculaceae bacterium]
MPFLVQVRVTPGAARQAVGGAWTGPDGAPRLVVKVTAPPDEGRANRAVESLLASAFGLSKSAAAITSGEKSRLKTVALDGGDERALEQRLQELLGGKS